MFDLYIACCLSFRASWGCTCLCGCWKLNCSGSRLQTSSGWHLQETLCLSSQDGGQQAKSCCFYLCHSNPSILSLFHSFPMMIALEIWNRAVTSGLTCFDVTSANVAPFRGRKLAFRIVRPCQHLGRYFDFLSMWEQCFGSVEMKCFLKR